MTYRKQKWKPDSIHMELKISSSKRGSQSINIPPPQCQTQQHHHSPTWKLKILKHPPRPKRHRFSLRLWTHLPNSPTHSITTHGRVQITRIHPHKKSLKTLRCVELWKPLNRTINRKTINMLCPTWSQRLRSLQLGA